MNKKILIIFYAIFTISLLYYIDQNLEVSYFLKVILKIILFSISIFFNKDLNFLKFKSIKSYKKGYILSILAFTSIMLTYYLIKDFIDISEIKYDFTNKYKLTGIKFFIASFYLIFINSFLEEYFFRGFLFFNFENKYFRNIFSSFAFSIYHLANFKNWFENYFLLIIPLVGLIIAGLFFNYLNSSKNDIYNSYIPHLIADLAIVIIGYQIILK